MRMTCGSVTGEGKQPHGGRSSSDAPSTEGLSRVTTASESSESRLYEIICLVGTVERPSIGSNNKSMDVERGIITGTFGNDDVCCRRELSFGKANASRAIHSWRQRESTTDAGAQLSLSASLHMCIHGTTCPTTAHKQTFSVMMPNRKQTNKRTNKQTKKQKKQTNKKQTNNKLTDKKTKLSVGKVCKKFPKECIHFQPRQNFMIFIPFCMPSIHIV